jgi:hypothetical protein
VKWFLKAAAFALVLTLPGHWLAPAYERLLLYLTGMVLGVPLSAPVDRSADLSASNQLTVFIALCLASDFASWPQRLRAVAFGLPALIATECATGLLGLRLEGAGGSNGAHSLEQMLELTRWVCVPLAWGVLLGRTGLAAFTARGAWKPSR